MPEPISPVTAVKQAVAECVAAMEVAEPLFGTVVSAEPLEIQVEAQAKPLSGKRLVLTRNVTDYEVDVSVSLQSEETAGGGGYAEFASHGHAVKGRKKIKVHNALAAGERVLLLQMTGGRRFLVLDRMGPAADLKGEWI